METIYKYPFSTDDHFTIDMPEGAEILSLQMQGAIPTIWALVDRDARKITRFFAVYGTGHPIETGECNRKFIGTYQEAAGALIFHVFEIISPFPTGGGI